jgi:hypothetical protein
MRTRSGMDRLPRFGTSRRWLFGATWLLGAALAWAGPAPAPGPFDSVGEAGIVLHAASQPAPLLRLEERGESARNPLARASAFGKGAASVAAALRSEPRSVDGRASAGAGWDLVRWSLSHGTSTSLP